MVATGLTLVAVGSEVPPVRDGGAVVAGVREAGIPSGSGVALMGMEVKVAVEKVRVGAGVGGLERFDVALGPVIALTPT